MEAEGEAPLARGWRHKLTILSCNGLHQKQIEKLCISEEVWVSNQEDLCLVVESYFSLLFTVDPEWKEPNLSFISTKFSREDNAKLVTPFSIDEFKHALFQMHPDKSLRPDRFNSTFYQKLWPLVGNDLFTQCTIWLNDLQSPLR